MQLFVTLAIAVDEPEEMRIVPILTVTLVETLLNLLLIDLVSNASHEHKADARETVSKLLSFDARYQEFKAITGISLREAIGQSDPSFWSNWEYVRQRRNRFVHGSFYALSWLACERSWKVATTSVRVFQSLHNAYVLKLETGTELHPVTATPRR